MMNCQEVESKILEYCDAPASSELHNQVSLHLQRCEPCRNNYKLTRAESEILSESDEIPTISPEFTSSVMNALKNTQKLYPHSPIEMIKEQPVNAKKRPPFMVWGSLAAAAIIGLGIYSAGTYVPFKNISFVDTSVGKQEIAPTNISQPDSTISSTPPMETLAGQPPVESPAKPTGALKTNAVDTLAVTPKLMSTPSGQESSRQTLTATPVNPSLQDTNYTLSDVYIADVPEQFHLTGINKINGNQAEYSYSSTDGQQNFTVFVYLVSPSAGGQPAKSKITAITSIGTQKVVIGLSGDLPDQFLQKVADTIQLRTIKP